jgi:tetratricopeptide (TPR) repeat protein
MARNRLQAEEASIQPGVLDQVNLFAQKHGRLIVFAGSLLIVLIVLLVANYYWNRARLERGLDSIAAAMSSAELQAIRSEYRDLPEVHAQLLQRLGDHLYREGRLEEAQKVFAEFKELYPRHSHIGTIERVLKRLNDDLAFVETSQAGMLREHELYGHPALRASLHAADGAFGPLRPIRPIVEIQTTLHGDDKRRAELLIELSPLDAEKGCAHLLELAKNDRLKDVRWEISEQEGMLRSAALTGEAPVADLPVQPSNLPIEEGTVMLVPGAEGKDWPARLQIALKELPELSGRVTVVGYVIGHGRLDLKSIGPSDRILALRAYEPGAPRPLTRDPGHDHDHDHDHE